MDNTIIAALLAVVGGLSGVLAGSSISRKSSMEAIEASNKNTLDLMQRQNFNKAANDLRASFAPQLAYLGSLRSTEGSNGGVEETREYLYDAFAKCHAADLCKFRFFIISSGRDIAAYDKACEKYQEHLYQGFTVDLKGQSPQEYFIEQINDLLNFAK